MPAQHVGRTFGRYRVIEVIGAGGMGEVYRARDEHLRRDVAVKCLSTGKEDESRSRMRREAHALSKLNHPNIATVHDFGHQDGVDYVVMELITGMSLADRVKAGPLLPDEAVDIARQVAAGLEDAHAHGVVHRDLKPGNVMLTARGQVKIVDFGVAWQAPDLGSATMTSVEVDAIAGTLPYMSPEQIRGDLADARSDIWALGVLLFELLTGKRPFDGANALLTAEKILNTRPPSARAVNPAVPAWLDQLIASALEKALDRRVQTMADVSARLQPTAPTAPAAAYPALASPAAPLWRRRRVVVAAVALLAVLAAGLAGGRRLFTGAPSSSAPRMSMLVADTVNRTGDAAFDETVVELLSTSLEQSQSLAIYPRSRVAHVLGLMRRETGTPVDAAVGREILQREGLGALVSSTVSRLGDAYVLLVTVEDASGSALASSRQVFDRAGDLPSRIDQAVQEVRAGLGESAPSIQANAVPLADVTSGSLEAVRLYTRARQRLHAGDAENAMALLRSALELDPDFAMAHEYLGVAYTNLQDPARAEQHIARAVALVDRVPAAERHKILGDFHMLKRNYEEACTQLQMLVELRPLDPTPLMSLGWCKGLRYDFTAGAADTRRALDMQPTARGRVNLARLIFLGGNAQGGLDQADDVRREQPGNMQAQFVAAQASLALRRLDDAARAYQAMIAVGGSWELEGHMGLADIELARGRDDEGRAELETAARIAARLGNEIAGGRASVALAELALARGDRAGAAGAIAPFQRSSHLTMQWLLARTNAAAGLRAAAPSLLPQPVPGDWVLADKSLAAMIRAERALAAGDAAAAVREADLAWELDRSVNARELQARAYVAAGRAADAASAYSDVLTRAPERIDAFDKPGFHRVVDAEYRLGVLLDEMGETGETRQRERAREVLERFLTVRGVGSEGVRETDARRRLALMR